MTQVILRCGSCGGTGGKVAQKLTDTLAAVTGEWQPTQALADTMRCGATNMSNRLAVLLERGLVERRGGGANRSPYEWRRATQAGSRELWRCKHRKPAGGIVDGCGWQGSPVYVQEAPGVGSTVPACPDCGSRLVRRLP